MEMTAAVTGMTLKYLSRRITSLWLVLWLVAVAELFFLPEGLVLFLVPRLRLKGLLAVSSQLAVVALQSLLWLELGLAVLGPVAA